MDRMGLVNSASSAFEHHGAATNTMAAHGAPNRVLGMGPQPILLYAAYSEWSVGTTHVATGAAGCAKERRRA